MVVSVGSGFGKSIGKSEIFVKKISSAPWLPRQTLAIAKIGVRLLNRGAFRLLIGLCYEADNNRLSCFSRDVSRPVLKLR